MTNASTNIAFLCLVVLSASVGAKRVEKRSAQKEAHVSNSTVMEPPNNVPPAWFEPVVWQSEWSPQCQDDALSARIDVASALARMKLQKDLQGKLKEHSGKCVYTHTSLTAAERKHSAYRMWRQEVGDLVMQALARSQMKESAVGAKDSDGKAKKFEDWAANTIAVSGGSDVDEVLTTMMAITSHSDTYQGFGKGDFDFLVFSAKDSAGCFKVEHTGCMFKSAVVGDFWAAIIAKSK